FGNFDKSSGELLGPDFSCHENTLQAIRFAAAGYMKDHPEEFIDVIEGNNKQISSVIMRAQQIEDLSKGVWFEKSELLAISSIVQRPIHILVDEKIRKNKNGSIAMEVINDHWDTNPIYLCMEGNHFDCMIPKRIGVQPILPG